MWHYKVEMFDVEANGAAAFEGLLAELGRQGWELITITPAFGQMMIVFKKRAP